MSVVIILVFAAIVMAGAFLVAFIWSVKSGQYEDTYTPSVRMLFEDPALKEEPKDRGPKTEKESRGDQVPVAKPEPRNPQPKS
jgi:cbb3-type cytochrome oxidase maturation protein